MRWLNVLLILCASAQAFAGPKRELSVYDRSALHSKIKKAAKSLGVIPVESHEDYGPFKMWVVNRRGGVSNFEARFVSIKNGVVVLGIDDRASVATGTKQMQIYGIPLTALPYPEQKWAREEQQRRTKTNSKLSIPDAIPVDQDDNPKPAEKKPSSSAMSKKKK